MNAKLRNPKFGLRRSRKISFPCEGGEECGKSSKRDDLVDAIELPPPAGLVRLLRRIPFLSKKDTQISSN